MRATRPTMMGVLLVTGLVATACATPPQPAPPSLEERLTEGIDGYRAGVPMMESVRAVIVEVGGRTVVEEYLDSGPEDSRSIASVTKSVVSTLIGIAVDEGLLSVDQTLVELLPDYAAVMTPDVARTTLEQLLTMTGGFRENWNVSAQDEAHSVDWVADALAHAVGSTGSRFAYSDDGAHVIAAILARAAGRSVFEYAREKLFDPLGIDSNPAAELAAIPENIPEYEAAGFAWPVDPQGVHLGASLLKITPRDMARLGVLYLEEGRWAGRTIVSEQWIHEATRARVDSRGAASEYGYLWWVTTADDEPAYFAVGLGGQLIEVVPSRDLVVVVSTEYDIADLSTAQLDSWTLTNLVDQVVAPDSTPTPTPTRPDDLASVPRDYAPVRSKTWLQSFFMLTTVHRSFSAVTSASSAPAT